MDNKVLHTYLKRVFVLIALWLLVFILYANGFVHVLLPTGVSLAILIVSVKFLKYVLKKVRNDD